MAKKKKATKAKSKTHKKVEELKSDFDGSIFWSPKSNNGGITQNQFLKIVLEEKYPILLMGIKLKKSVDPIMFMALRNDKSSFNYMLSEETQEYDLVKYWIKALKNDDYEVAEYHLEEDAYVCSINDKLTTMLYEAINNEEYLLAAEIRDMININKIEAEKKETITKPKDKREKKKK